MEDCAKIEGIEGDSPALLLVQAVDEIRRLVDYGKQVGELAADDFEIIAAALVGSRVEGIAKLDSDLDIVVEYKGKMWEDSAFNYFGQMREAAEIQVGGIPLDVNPIRADKTGTLQEWLHTYHTDKRVRAPQWYREDESYE